MFNALSYCIFTGSNYFAAESLNSFKQIAILENSDECFEGNSKHLAYNRKQLRILPPKVHSNPKIVQAFSQVGIDYFYGNPNCSGLSSINRNANASSSMNQYIHEFFRMVKDYSPSIFFMENAPHLTGSRGWPILSKIITEVKDDYTVTVCRDLGWHHGVCMHRQRSLIVGFKRSKFDNMVYSLKDFTSREPVGLFDIIEKPSKDPSTVSDIHSGIEAAVDTVVTERLSAIRQVYEATKHRGAHGALYLMAASDKRTVNNRIVDFQFDWDAWIGNAAITEAQDVSLRGEVQRIIDKINNGQRIWDKSPVVVGPDIKKAPSLTAVTFLYNIEAGRGFTCREYARMMGYPEDFNFCPGVTVGHIAQGVPAAFAKHVHQNALEILSSPEEASSRGKREDVCTQFGSANGSKIEFMTHESFQTNYIKSAKKDNDE